VAVLQPRLHLLHLVVTIAMGLLGCDSYMLIATLIAKAKVVLNCNIVLGSQLLQLIEDSRGQTQSGSRLQRCYMIIAMRTLEGEAKVVLNCNTFLES
jgi:hypothetical protein